MYSSSINTMYTPFPQLTSTIHGLSPSNFFYQERDSAVFLENRHDLLHGIFFPSDAAAPGDNVAADKPRPPQISSKRSSKTKNINISKKDRHSKIFTAHGPRDRRVRLSMEIARKFFDLQDMLGFDKASKTLDWLLNNSKDSIKELVHMKTKISTHNTNCNNTTGCLFEMVYNNNGVGNEKIRDAFDMSSRESRAKARARARDRTREKMRAREIMGEDQSLRMNGHDFTATTSPSQSSRSWPQIEHIPDIWDISTDLIPPELQYHGKPWDVCNNHTIPVD